jgi:hypothetical protein
MLFGGNKFHVAAPISAFANANLPEAIPLRRRPESGLAEGEMVASGSPNF